MAAWFYTYYSLYFAGSTYLIIVLKVRGVRDGHVTVWELVETMRMFFSGDISYGPRGDADYYPVGFDTPVIIIS